MLFSFSWRHGGGIFHGEVAPGARLPRMHNRLLIPGKKSWSGSHCLGRPQQSGGQPRQLAERNDLFAGMACGATAQDAEGARSENFSAVKEKPLTGASQADIMGDVVKGIALTPKSKTSSACFARTLFQEENTMVKLRLTRMGSKKKPFYRIVASTSTAPRDGRFIEVVGTYNPVAQPAIVSIDEAKALKWLSEGAQPTDTVRALFSKQGIMTKFHDAKSAK